MAYKKIFCPECGQETQVNDERGVGFCSQCGKKIVLRTDREAQRHTQSHEPQNAPSEQSPLEDEVGKKLAEVAFYYQLSHDKQEASNYNEEPRYYLKAQDMLVDLSLLYPNDYRVWWELCKPIDFASVADGVDTDGRYQINEDYFSKALDGAALPEKRILIEEHDKYIAEKKAARDRAETKRREEEAERRCKEEQKKREEYQRLEAQRAQDEERRRRQEEERRKQQEEERSRQQEEQEKRLRQQRLNEQKGLELSAPLWAALSEKDYSCIDNGYFQFSGENKQTIIGIFKSVSNVMNLMAFHIDGNKGNAVYRDQTISIKFDGNGHGIKFDNSPVRIKGMIPQQSDLFIANNGTGGLTVNGLELCVDREYVMSIMKSAKKPLIAFSKYFI